MKESREKAQNARPELATRVNNFDDYDVVFIGGPVWWSDLPMAMYTFIDKHDWSDKTVIPFTTHEGSGLGSVPSELKKATKTKVLSGLAIYGHVAQNNREETDEKVAAWLKELGF